MPLTRRTATVELADGRVLSVRIINPDTLRYEATAQRNGWPSVTVKDGAATVVSMQRQVTFEIWAALTRTGQYSGKWEAFEKTDCVDFDVTEEQVDPTRPDPATDSSPSSPGSDDAPSPNSLLPTTS